MDGKKSQENSPPFLSDLDIALTVVLMDKKKEEGRRKRGEMEMGCCTKSPWLQIDIAAEGDRIVSLSLKKIFYGKYALSYCFEISLLPSTQAASQGEKSWEKQILDSVSEPKI